MIDRVCSISLFFTIATSLLLPAQDTAFTLIKKDGPIAIYERWVKFPGSNPSVTAREVKGVFTFNNSTQAALNLIKNEEKINEWQKHVSEFKVIPHRDSSLWYEYSYHDIPWPVSDQDHFLEYKITVNNGNELIINFSTKSDNKLAPVRKGVTRMKLTGSWTLEQISASKTKATYRIMSMPGNIPTWLTDPIIHRNIMITIKEFIQIMNTTH